MRRHRDVDAVRWQQRRNRARRRILIHDRVVNENGSAPPFAALFSEYARLLEGAGFADITFTTVSENAPKPTTPSSARRP